MGKRVSNNIHQLNMLEDEQCQLWHEEIKNRKETQRADRPLFHSYDEIMECFFDYVKFMDQDKYITGDGVEKNACLSLGTFAFYAGVRARSMHEWVIGNVAEKNKYLHEAAIEITEFMKLHQQEGVNQKEYTHHVIMSQLGMPKHHKHEVDSNINANINVSIEDYPDAKKRRIGASNRVTKLVAMENDLAAKEDSSKKNVSKRKTTPRRKTSAKKKS